MRGQLLHAYPPRPFYVENFLIGHVILVLFIKNDILLKNCFFRGNDGRYDKMLRGKVVCLNNICKFPIQHFLVERIVFDLNIKNDIEKLRKAMLSEKYMRS